MIVKQAVINITEEEISSPEPIKIELTVKAGEEEVTYTITYPKA